MNEGRGPKNPLLGAAVVKTVLRRAGGEGTSLALYQGLLRDLKLSDEDVERYLAQHAGEVEAAIKSHGRR